MQKAFNQTKDFTAFKKIATSEILKPDVRSFNSIQVGSNGMPITAWKDDERNRHKDRQMYLIKLQWVA